MDNKVETTPRERRVMTLNEAAVLLRISRGSAYEAAKRGEIPTIRIGRRLLVPLAAFERMLAGNAAA
jgi:excisionase family DNA binding protein